jgi:hypothetical protein
MQLALVDGLVQVCKQQPDDPVDYLVHLYYLCLSGLFFTSFFDVDRLSSYSSTVLVVHLRKLLLSNRYRRLISSHFEFSLAN